MIIGSGQFTYEWTEEWAKLPATASHLENGRTHGVAVLNSGEVVVFAQGNPAVLFFAADGTLSRSWGERFGGAHGLTLVREGDAEFLWLTDQHSGEVVKTDLSGRTIQQIQKPVHPAYREGRWAPTWVAVNPLNGDIWVADGYGSHLVHRHDRTGRYLQSIDGSEGQLGRFNCPHGIAFDTRGGGARLCITDRGNQRLQIYDAAGKYLRGVTNVFHSPCGFDFYGQMMLIPELKTGLKLVQGETEVCVELGANIAVTTEPGWPNFKGTPKIQAGRFNSPHAACFDRAGNIYVVEWIIGGRITRLLRKS